MRFGILGTGNIAGQFAQDVQGIAGGTGAQRSVVTAVASRSAESAAAFGKRFGLPSEKCYSPYKHLLRDEEIDAVYISLPNHLHAEWAIKALHAGKHVLCEKPFTLNAAEAERVLTEAELSGKRVMEAFMYRCHPLIHAALDAVRSGAIGELRMIRASFCYRTNNIENNIRFDPTLGGGSLMDIGSYCLNFARLFAGSEPTQAHIVGHQHSAGVDDYACAILKFPTPAPGNSPGIASGNTHRDISGTLRRPGDTSGGGSENEITAALTFGMTTQLNNAAILGGTEGYLEIPIPWKPPQRGAIYTLRGQTPPKQNLAASGKPSPPPVQTFTVDAPAPLYAGQADAFVDAVRSGGPMPVTAQDTLGNMRLLDELRGQLGLPW